MEKKREHNPYNFTTPIKDPNLFAGRSKELEEIIYYLQLSKNERPNYVNISLVGPRSVGKTSLINMIEYIASNLGLLPIKIPLNTETVQNDVLFFKELFDGILTKGAEKGMYGGFTGKIYKAFRTVMDTLDLSAEIPFLFGSVYIGFKRKHVISGIPQHILIHDLQEIHNEAKKSGIATIVLLFDECDLLAENEVLLQKIRNVFMELEGYVLVFSGTEKMFPALQDTFSPIPRFFKRINIENFRDIKETEECLLKPLNEDEKKIFDRACIHEIHRITNGSPYEINLIAHYMYRRWTEGKTKKLSLSPEVLDDVLDELERLRKGGHYEIANKIKRYWRDQLRILISLLEFPNVPKEWLAEYTLLNEIDTLRLKDIYAKKSITMDYVENLEKDGIISEENGKIKFNGDHFDTLYLKYFGISKGAVDSEEFFVGFWEDPIINLHHKFVENILLRDIPEYYIYTAFDKRERINGKTGQKFIIGARAKLPPGEHTILELSPKTREEFYLGAPISVRFRVNVEWMKEGFVTQVKFKKEEDMERFKNRLSILMEKLGLLGYEILLKDEISWNTEGAELLRQGKLREAIDYFDKAIKINPSFELPWCNKAKIFLNLKKFDEALEYINKTLELHPKWSDALSLKGIILINLKKNEEAIECLEKAITINPEDWSAWDNKGRALFNLKKYNEAINCFDRSLKYNKVNYDALYLKGLSLFFLGSFEEALNCFEKALEINPGFTPASMAKGNILLNKKDYAEALNYFDAVLKKEPNNIDALILKGVSLSGLGRYQEAIEYCDKVLQINENNGVAWFNKACFKARMNDVSDAIECLKKAIQIDDTFIEIAKSEEDLAILKKNDEFLSLIQKKTKS